MLSYSKLKDYHTCPRLYKLRHIDKVVPFTSSLETEFGNALHLGLNEILNKEGDGQEMFSVYWESVDPKISRLGRYSYEDYSEMGPKFLARFERLHAKHFEPAFLEERIEAKLAGHEFVGIPDFLGLYKGVPSVLDFKTSSRPYDPRQVVVDEQMPIYAHLAKEYLGFEATQVVFFVFVKDPTAPRIQRPIIRELTDVVQSSTIENVIETCDEIASKEKFLKNTSSCIRGPIVCPAYEHCWGKKNEQKD